jgi:hypothetical protein
MPELIVDANALFQFRLVVGRSIGGGGYLGGLE